MTFRVYLLIMGLGTLIAWAGWVFILITINPYQSGLIGLFLFYLTLGIGLIGLLTLFGILYRVMLLKRKDVLSREVRTSFRHALLLSAVCVISLLLSAQGVLHWWVLVVLISVAGVLEYVSLLAQSGRRG